MNVNKEDIQTFKGKLFFIITELQNLLIADIESVSSYEQICDDLASAKAYLAQVYEEITKNAVHLERDSNIIKCDSSASHFEDNLYGKKDKFLKDRIRKAQEGIY